MYTREEIVRLLVHYPRFVGLSSKDKTGVPAAGDAGRLPSREDVLVQRSRSHCAPWEPSAVMYADLESALRSLSPWRSGLTVLVTAHRYDWRILQREGEFWGMSAKELRELVHDVVESLFVRMNGLSVSDYALTRPARM